MRCVQNMSWTQNGVNLAILDLPAGGKQKVSVRMTCHGLAHGCWDGGPRWLHVKKCLELRGGLGGLELAGELTSGMSPTKRMTNRLCKLKANVHIHWVMICLCIMLDTGNRSVMTWNEMIWLFGLILFPDVWCGNDVLLVKYTDRFVRFMKAVIWP